MINTLKVGEQNGKCLSHSHYDSKGSMVVRAEFSLLDYMVPPSSRPLLPHAVKDEERVRFRVCVCVCVFMVQAWCLCTSLLLTFHRLKLTHSHLLQGMLGKVVLLLRQNGEMNISEYKSLSLGCA